MVKGENGMLEERNREYGERVRGMMLKLCCQAVAANKK
jgi:hypothetical protein